MGYEHAVDTGLASGIQVDLFEGGEALLPEPKVCGEVDHSVRERVVSGVVRRDYCGAWEQVRGFERGLGHADRRRHCQEVACLLCKNTVGGGHTIILGRRRWGVPLYWGCNWR